MASPTNFRHLSSLRPEKSPHHPPSREAAAAAAAAQGLFPAMNYKSMGGSSGAPALARQSSVYSLTFDEFQSTMGGFGKDFGSMNMDELLKNIWTAEESQAMTSAPGAALPAVEAAAGPSGYGGLQRQGSLTLPRTLSQKTVDEVWRDLVGVQGGGVAGEAEFRQQRQPTLGEMTLEEFLVRAGVVREEMNQSLNQSQSQNQIVNQPMPPRPIVNGGANAISSIFGDLPVSNSSQGLVLGFSQQPRNGGAIVSHQIPNGTGTNLSMTGAAAPARPYPVPLAPLGNASDLASQQRVRGGGIMGIGDQPMNNGLMQGLVGLGGGGGVAAAAMSSPANQISSDGLAKSNGDLSSLSPLPYVYAGGIRGRKCSGAVEKVVERRQKRMIKNRESAARSRARKQAYTMELEAEVAKLKEQNQELQKKQAEILEMQKTQVLEIINQQHGHKKRCLRRTHTGPW